MITDVENCVWDGNEVDTGVGGGVSIWDGSTAFFSNSAFTNNIAVLGGGFYIQETSRGVMSAVTFIGNFARSNGAGVYVQLNGEIDISMSTMTDNTAQGRGNALFVDSPNFVKITTTNFSPFDGASTVYLAGAAAGCNENPCDPGSSCSYADYSVTCTPCAANTYSADGLTCGLCAAGTGPNAAQTACDACSADQVSGFGVCTATPYDSMQCRLDSNDDGVLGTDDLLVLLANFGRTC